MGVRGRAASASMLRALGIGSTLYGALLLASPRSAVAAVGGDRTPPPDLVVRVLGVRQLGQGGALLVRPVPSTAVLGAAVDALHALTMVAAAVRWPAYRRVASVSAAVAFGSAVLALLAT